MTWLVGGVAALGVVLLAGPAFAEAPLTPLRPLGAAQHHQPQGKAGDAQQAEAREGGVAADAPIKAGQWQFTSQLQGSAAPAAAGNGMPTTYLSCIRADNALPAEIAPQCKLDRVEHRGPDVTWAMSCATTGVKIDGTAHYQGDTMDGTMISHLPGKSGKISDITQRITGRYVGPCPRSAEGSPSQSPETGGAGPKPHPEASSKAETIEPEPAASATIIDAAPARSADRPAPEQASTPQATPAKADEQKPAAAAEPANRENASPDAAGAAQRKETAHHRARREYAARVPHRHFAHPGYYRYHYGGWGSAWPSSSAPHPFGPSPNGGFN